MITYVINTSENKTFESDQLFGAASYNKIRWINCRLNEVASCADVIYMRQNVLGADQFRIAVIIDFYNFDRIRIPYGRDRYGEEKGVDLSLYMPYIEIFLDDNLIAKLEKRDLYAKDYEVYYVQNEKYENLEFLDNAENQLSYILSGVPDETEEEGVFRTFSLYCTNDVSLTFNLSDYPYDDPSKGMTFSEFFRVFKQRSAGRSHLRCHYFVTSYGSGPVSAALDTLSLSLYLIRVYEREESVSDVGYMEIPAIDEMALKEVLCSAWMKIDLARKMAAENQQQQYFSLKQRRKESVSQEDSEDFDADALNREYASLVGDARYESESVENMYWTIIDYDEKNDDVISAENRQEFDTLFSKYLRKRDETSETRVEVEFDELRKMGALVMTDQCPSKEQYEQVVNSKHQVVSDLFQRALDAEYIEVDYSEERKKGVHAYEEYNKWKACIRKNIVGDLIFMVITILVMLFPYRQLQLGSLTSVGPRILYFLAVGVFAGIFIVSFVLNMLIPLWRMRQEKYKLKEQYLQAVAKRRHSFYELKRRYEKDLIRIEEVRYEIRQITHLFEMNMAKERSVTKHRIMLEELQDRLSSILSNLGVEPVYDTEFSILGEFDLNKSFYTKDNSIYQIFSVEAIEKLFPRNRREDA